MSLENLINRLTVYAHTVGVPVEEVVSIKLRPVKLGAQNEDDFGKLDENAYQYASEYHEGLKHLKLDHLPLNLSEKISPLIGHPIPDNLDSARCWPTNPRVIWVQHETGLEILGAISAVITILGASVTAFRWIQKKIQENQNDEDSDREYRDVPKIRIETRKIIGQSQIHQTLIFRGKISEPIDIKAIKELIIQDIEPKTK